jgi:hypothetical protein
MSRARWTPCEEEGDACYAQNHIRSGFSAFMSLTHWNNVCCRKDATACYLEAKLEYGFIWKPYKQ